MSIRYSKLASRSFIIGRRLWPPATSRAELPSRSIKPMASLTVVARWYSNGAGTCMVTPRLVLPAVSVARRQRCQRPPKGMLRSLDTRRARAHDAVVKEILGDVDRWRRQGRRVALARVIDVEGSGPREPGATMAVSENGEVAGSVSGGCVEGAVMEAALDSLATGDRGLLTFGYSDADAFAVGLTCGGTVHLYVEPLEWTPDVEGALVAALMADEPVALATIVAGRDVGAKLLYRPGTPLIGSLGTAELDAVVGRDAAGELAAGSSRLRHYGGRGEIGRDEVSVFIESFVAPARMIIFGAVDFTAAPKMIM